jgi:hypothetical protein
MILLFLLLSIVLPNPRVFQLDAFMYRELPLLLVPLVLINELWPL